MSPCKNILNTTPRKMGRLDQMMTSSVPTIVMRLVSVFLVTLGQEMGRPFFTTSSSDLVCQWQSCCGEPRRMRSTPMIMKDAPNHHQSESGSRKQKYPNTAVKKKLHAVFTTTALTEPK
jgi:hypothetical protein